MAHVHCPRCEHRVQPRGRSVLWWVALVGLAGFFVSMVLASSLIGPFIVGAVPIMSAVGFAFGPLWALCTEDPTCPKCGRSLAARHLPTEPARRPARRASVVEQAA